MNATAYAASPSRLAQDSIPEYLSKTYTWAYLSRRSIRWLDHSFVVSAILWGNAGRLIRDSVAQFRPGERVLQAACVYGRYTLLLADRLGRAGHLTVTDVAPVQLDNVARKIAGRPQIQLYRGDLAEGHTGVAPHSLDAAACFFLLHEVPPLERRRIVEALLGSVRVGGRVVFTDYHQPSVWHPLRPIMKLVFRLLEPYATSLLNQSLEIISPACAHFRFSKKTTFGGLYQQVIATRLI